MESTGRVPYESDAYLTSYVLFGLLIMAGLWLARRLPVVSLTQDRSARFVGLFLLAGLPCLSIAVGETYMLDQDAYVLHIYTNPFLWLHKLTDRVTQFRALGRFIWPFWWAVVLGFSWYAGHWQHRPVLRGVLAGLGLMLAVDTKNAMGFYKDVHRENLLTSAGATAPLQELVGWIDVPRYQAVLPLPLFHSGAEATPSYNLDPDDPHCNRTYQLNTLTNLPTMSVKATRMVPEDARLIMTLLQPGGPDPALLARMDNRPVLVYLDSTYFNGENNYYREGLKERPELLALFERTDDFIREQNLKVLRHEGNLWLFEWQPKPVR